jgi:methylmalonyl-CoA/ethylmalonyl-CoA epimerase
MTTRIAHIGIAVKNLEASKELFGRLTGTQASHEETVDDQNVRTALFQFGGEAIELLEGTGPESAISRFIEKRGEGIHHIALVVDNIGAELARLKSQGFQLIDEQPRVGAGNMLVAFVHPKSTNGVLIELSQPR